MSKPAIDKRKLKDSVAEYLVKGKLDKAVEALEQLVLAEPKDITHKLKLGECYRKLDRPDKAIICFQSAAKAYSDLGQLNKGIAAVKVILEIDPRNAEARRELRQMNEQRFGKAAMDGAGLRRGNAGRPAAGGRAALGIDESTDESVSSIDEAFDEVIASDRRGPLDGDDPSGPITDEVESDPVSHALQPSGGLEFSPEDLGGSVEPELPKPLARVGLKKSMVAPAQRRRNELSFGLGEPDVQDLPDEAILADEPEDLAAGPDDDEVIDPSGSAAPAGRRRRTGGRELDLDVPEDEVLDLEGPPPKRRIDLDLGSPGSAKAATKPARNGRSAPDPATKPHREVEISIDTESAISDLLSPDGEEEIELFSIALDKPRAEPSGASAGIQEAVNAIAARSRHKTPTIRVPLFDDLAPGVFNELVNKLSYRRYGSGQQILHEGDPGRSFFVIAEGKVRIWKNIDGKELTLAQLEEGAFFGEMALLSGAPRAANVSALDETELLEVTDGVLREIAQKHPAVIQSLKNFYRQRLLSNAMTISPIFRDFSPGDRKQIVAKFKLRQAAPGEVLIKEGKQSDGLYVVLHGTVEVSAMNVSLARLKEGEIFGEMSLLSRDPATATVTSPTNTLLLRLGRAQFQELIVTHPQILALVSYLSEQRAAANRAAMKKQGNSTPP